MVTDRLRLLPWRAEDAPLFFPIASDTEVVRHITGGIPLDQAAVAAFIERQARALRERAFCRWRLERIDNGETIGFCGLGMLPGFDEPEIGWWLGRAHWRQGYATEAARAAMADAFTRCAVPKIISITVAANKPSLRVMRRLGLRFERYAMHAARLHLVHTMTLQEWSSL